NDCALFTRSLQHSCEDLAAAPPALLSPKRDRACVARRPVPDYLGAHGFSLAEPRRQPVAPKAGRLRRPLRAGGVDASWLGSWQPGAAAADRSDSPDGPLGDPLPADLACDHPAAPDSAAAASHPRSAHDRRGKLRLCPWASPALRLGPRVPSRHGRYRDRPKVLSDHRLHDARLPRPAGRDLNRWHDQTPWRKKLASPAPPRPSP